MSKLGVVVIESILRMVRDSQGAGERSQALDVVRRSLLEFGSETEDNLNALSELVVAQGKYSRGLGIQGAGGTLAELINALEGTPLPPELKTQFPGLSQEKWESALRVTTLILLAIEIT